MTKSIDELYFSWLDQDKYRNRPGAYRAGHLQGSLDSLDLLKRAHDVIELDSEVLGLSEVTEILTELEDQIGYIESQVEKQ